MKLEDATVLAAEVCDLLRPACSRIEIAGGVRRGKAEPHDIEIVATPKWGNIFGYFGDEQTVNMLDSAVILLLEKKTLTQGDTDKAGKKAPCGPKYYRLKYRGEKLDLFVVLPPAQWGTVFLIRTGDAEFSHAFVTRLWDYGLKSKDGHIEDNAGVAQPTPEETDAFKLCRLPYIEPASRTLQTIQAVEPTGASAQASTPIRTEAK
jgi:DNA polymerase/3'-5' exonuclease PolX